MTIISAVPIPPIVRNPGRAPRYPFADMKPGDCFYSTDPAKRVRDAANQYRRNHALGTTWTVRTVVEDGVKGCRLWRVK